MSKITMAVAAQFEDEAHRGRAEAMVRMLVPDGVEPQPMVSETDEDGEHFVGLKWEVER
jgi:hypothetical protein